jgi:hypothetical protein
VANISVPAPASLLFLERPISFWYSDIIHSLQTCKPKVQYSSSLPSIGYIPNSSFPSGERSIVPIVHEAGWAPEPVWTLWRRKIYLVPARNRTLAVLSVARRYTD